MKRASISQLEQPSKTLMRFANELSSGSHKPVLDAGCGLGRNAVALALRGLTVVCADRDVGRLRVLSTTAPQYISSVKSPHSTVGQLFPVCADLDQTKWPFSTSRFSAITCVHFLKIELFDELWSALVEGGYLFIETFGGQGRNYLELPKAGQLRDLLSSRFNISFYEEKKVGPIGYDAVSVKLLAQKK
jgi:SAM-dependent methyltransferase